MAQDIHYTNNKYNVIKFTKLSTFSRVVGEDAPLRIVVGGGGLNGADINMLVIYFRIT